LDCETAIYKKAKIIDLKIMNLDLKIDVLEDKISQQHKQKSEVK
jgi:hypothetical protein